MSLPKIQTFLSLSTAFPAQFLCSPSQTCARRISNAMKKIVRVYDEKILGSVKICFGFRCGLQRNFEGNILRLFKPTVQVIRIRYQQKVITIIYGDIRFWIFLTGKGWFQLQFGRLDRLTASATCRRKKSPATAGYAFQ